MKIEFVEPELPCPGAVAVGIWEEGALTPAARKLDGMTGGALARALSVSPRFHGRKDDLLTVVAPQGVPASRIVLVGLGKPAAMDARLLQDIGGLLGTHLSDTGDRPRRGGGARRGRSGGRTRLWRAPSLLSLRQVQDQGEAGAEGVPAAAANRHSLSLCGGPGVFAARPGRR